MSNSVVSNVVTQINQALDCQLTNYLYDRTQECIKELHVDYFAEKSFMEFCCEHLGHVSIAAKILAYRYFNTDIFRKLYQSLVPLAENVYGAEDLVLHPIFYLRYTFPELPQTEQHRLAFLDSQPHFDRSYGIKAFTFWIALVDIDDQTGGLCYFTDPKVVAEFSAGEKNRYNMDGYFENAVQVDSSLKPVAIQPHLKKGGVLTFDSNVLHGATKPKSKWRISFDVRLIPKEELLRADPRVQRTINLFHRSPTLCNANNLLFLGDYKGAARHFQSLSMELNNSALKYTAQTLSIKTPNPEILKSGAKMQWRDEYCWVK